MKLIYDKTNKSIKFAEQFSLSNKISASNSAGYSKIIEKL